MIAAVKTEGATRVLLLDAVQKVARIEMAERQLVRCKTELGFPDHSR